MGQENTLTILLFWIPQAIEQLLLWVYWWQTKEYRIDRFQVLFYTFEGRKNLGLSSIAIKLAILGVSYYWGNYLLLFAFFSFLDINFLLNIVRHKVRRPVFTLRAKELFATGIFGVLLVVLLVWGGFADFVFTLTLGELFVLLAPIVGIIWTSPLVFISKIRAIGHAKKVLSTVKPIVIGVTGSYGKTTTKEFIAHLLSFKYKVVKTEKSENTEFGVARRIVDSLKKGTQMLVVEIGAYRRGEIRRVANIVRPQLAIVTGVEPQHFALFGSLEAINKAKYELVQSLPDKGLAIFNYSNQQCRIVARWARRDGKTVVGYELNGKGRREKGEGRREKASVVARILSADYKGVTFEVSEGDKKPKNLFAPVPGVHFVENLTGAILVARKLGVNWVQIAKGCKTLVVPEGTMTLRQNRKLTIIDDSYNSTPLGFISAIEYLSLLDTEEKVVITPGIIELGKLSDRIHQDLGRRMAHVVDRIILTNSDVAKSFKKGLGSRARILEIVENADSLAQSINNLVNKKSVVLIEGRIPQKMMDFFKKK
ncbi:MAG: UDP-N-acetylmuramoyl-tripeptide--D-alanyl-D-alanine ligase [Candidatus Blackburnbacteria bacterium]|nr:UDP-N-acetylmuramoyl-tripeptide--D-alanyl-D-alanine ligase [Candidatus Blackburnbacteria bacterium]